MTQLFQRDVQVIAGPLLIEPRKATGENQPMLRVRFNIMKTNNIEPNKAQLEIWNLKEANRVKLQQKDLEVIIKAGYVDQIEQIFKGDSETTTIGRDSVNWSVKIELGDGSKQFQNARINKSFRGPQTVGAMLKEVAESMGIDPGNLVQKAREAGSVSVLKQILNGIIFSGKASSALDEFAAGLGLNVSVQDKSLQFLSKGEVLPGPAVKLSVSTGLIGSPQIGEKGIVSASSLLNGRIVPGRKVDLESAVISGSFVTFKAHHVGDTWGNDWNTNIEMKAL